MADCMINNSNDTKNEIDFVILWVDGDDKEWQKEKNKYDASLEKGDNTQVRYRSWDNLQYWFRGVEKFAPWVRKIHFVTWGHIPKWLDTTNPKLNIVKHEDYIPSQYLPTFSANTIELNLHRIKDLSEQFVFFNDDMFITRPVKKEDFFKNHIPCDTFGLNIIMFKKGTAGFFNANDVELINSNFDKSAVYKRDKKKWFNKNNGLKTIIRTLCLMPWDWFAGFFYDHLPAAYLKSTFMEVWEKEPEVLDETCMDKFRNKTNVNQWLIKYWQFAKGEYVPSKPLGKCFHIEENNFENAYDAVKKAKYKLTCINDTPKTTEFENKKIRLIEAFECILPEKSSFEK